jgi:hypothetical protein
MRELNEEIVKMKEVRDAYKQRYLETRYSPQPLRARIERSQEHKEQKLRLLGEIHGLIDEHRGR